MRKGHNKNLSKSCERRHATEHAPSNTMSDIQTSDVYKLVLGCNLGTSDLGTEDQLNINSQLNTQQTQKVGNIVSGSTSSLTANVKNEIIATANW